MIPALLSVKEEGLQLHDLSLHTGKITRHFWRPDTMPALDEGEAIPTQQPHEMAFEPPFHSQGH